MPSSSPTCSHCSVPKSRRPPAALVGWLAAPASKSLDDGFDFALSSTDLEWPGWVCEPLWHDMLAVAVAAASHLLIHREVPCHELLRSSLDLRAIYLRPNPWRALVHRLIGDAPRGAGR